MSDSNEIPDEKSVLDRSIAKVSSLLRALPTGSSALEIAGVKSWHQRWLAIRFEFIEPAPNPKRGKRQQRDGAMALVFNEAALAALRLPNDLERHINTALENAESQVFETIAEAMKSVRATSAQNTKFSRHCYLALRFADELGKKRESIGLEPEGTLRPRIKELVIDALKPDGHYGENETPRWAEVWKKTGIP